MHTTKSAEKITPFGGLNFCLESFHDSGLAALIDRHLGPRVQTVGFSYSDIIANQLAVFFAGGDCAEDLNEHLHGLASHIKGLSVAAPTRCFGASNSSAATLRSWCIPQAGSPIRSTSTNLWAI